MSPAQLSNLDSLGYTAMTPIQAEALPLALAGQDLIAQAKTGSGKTAAFALALINGLNPRDFGTQGLVLCPTRELATQVATEIRRLARHQQNIKVVVLCGGQPIGPQIGSLEHGAHIVVGTPGRIKDHLRKKTLSLERAATVVLDEADRMLDMGFVDDMVLILEQTPPQRQTLLFSATYPEDIERLSQRFQREPVHVSVESIHDQQQIREQLYICSKEKRLQALLKLLAHYQADSAVVFCNTKQLVREVCTTLKNEGVSVSALHGDLEQRERDQVLIAFKQQSCSILVATDVAARGLDIEDLPAVINFELPRDPEVYVHRIGRTGRAGREGLALSLFMDSERYKLDLIGDYLGRELSFEALETLPAATAALPAPAFVTLCIAGGRKQKIRPGDILGALTGAGGVEGKVVGSIDILPQSAFVAIEQPFARQALKILNEGKIKGRRFKVRKL